MDPMKKAMLDPESLRVDSFETSAAHAGVKALFTQGEYTCYTCGASPPLADVANRPTVYCCA
jgi:hypothetical protein